MNNTNTMSYQSSMAVNIIDQMKGSDVATVSLDNNKIVISQKNKIVAQWTGSTWVLGQQLLDILPTINHQCIEVINACTRLHRRALEYKDTKMQDSGISHSIRMIAHDMEKDNVDYLNFKGSVGGVWHTDVSYRICKQSTKDKTPKNPKEVFKLIKVTGRMMVLTTASYGFGTSLLAWRDINTNKISIASNFVEYIKNRSVNGTKEIIKDDILRQIAEYNNTKKR